MATSLPAADPRRPLRKLTARTRVPATLATLLALAFAVVSTPGCQSDGRQYARIETPMGDMRVMLYDETPRHRDNFVKLAGEGYYDSLLFHRVIEGFMVQGGDPDSRTASPGQVLGQGGPGYTVPAEIGAPHLRGALAAARLGGPANPDKESSGSQFYLVHGRPVAEAQLQGIERQKGIRYSEAQRAAYAEIGGTPGLDADYTVFGEVVEGMEVIDRIAAVDTDRSNRPREDVWMRITLE